MCRAGRGGLLGSGRGGWLVGAGLFVIMTVWAGGTGGGTDRVGVWESWL